MKHDLVVSLRDFAVLTSGITFGGQLMLLLAVLPGLRRIDLAEAFRFHQAVFSTDLPDRYIQPSGVLSMLAGIALLAVGRGSTADTVLAAAGVASILGVAVVTRAINRPINRQVGTWSADRVADYPAALARWQRGHLTRTAFGLIAFVSFIVLASH